MPCEDCKMLARVRELERKQENTDKFIGWAKPILDAVDTIHVNIRWMTIVAILFAGICSFVYVDEIKPFIKQYQQDKTHAEEKRHKEQVEVIKQIESLKMEIIKASKINYKATVKKFKEYQEKGK